MKLHEMRQLAIGERVRVFLGGKERVCTVRAVKRVTGQVQVQCRDDDFYNPGVWVAYEDVERLETGTDGHGRDTDEHEPELEPA